MIDRTQGWRPTLTPVLLTPLLILTPRLSLAAEEGGGHAEPFTDVLLTGAIVLIIALIGGGLAQRAKQPAVLGELLIGVIVGNIGYWLAIPSFIMIMRFSEAGELFRAVWSNGLGLETAAEEVFSSRELAPGEPVSQLAETLSGPDALRLLRTGLTL